MKLYKYILIAILFLTSLSYSKIVYARSMVADVNPRKIDIDQNFKGIDVLVYGARNDAGNIVVVVRGPKQDQILRKKGKIFGIWTNTKNIEIKNLYSYYAVSSMKPLTSIQNDILLKQLEVGTENLIITNDIEAESNTAENSIKAKKIKNSVIKLMQSKNLFSNENYPISFWGETLFRTYIKFPKNISKGIYNIDIYLFNDGLLHSFQTMPVIVDKVGLESYVSETALNRPLFYGLISVAIALSLGLLVGALFSKKNND
jgi:uncharacterized protein (TIGR02186 family)